MSTTLTTNGDGVNVLRITTDKRGLAARYRVGIRTVEAGRVMESSSVAAYSAEAKQGRVSVDWPSANSLTRAWRRVIEKAGLPYKRNAFRNSYITYRLILTEDIAKVAEVSAPRMIKKNYQSRAAISRATAEEWFAIRPQPRTKRKTSLTNLPQATPRDCKIKQRENYERVIKYNRDGESPHDGGQARLGGSLHGRRSHN
jgi:hypothetical protein